MDALASLGFVIACAALAQNYRLEKRVKELERPIHDEKAKKLLVTKAEVLALIEKSKKS